MNDMKRVTDGKHNDMVLYFTSNSLLQNDNRLVFIREENGCQNLWLHDLETGADSQITYFTDTAPHALTIHNFRRVDFAAIQVSSVVLHAPTGMLYFMKDRKIYRYDLKGNGRMLARLPDKTGSGCAHVSEDGTRFLISTVDDRAFDDYDGSDNDVIDARVQRLGLCSQLRVFDTETGEPLLCENVPGAWITHVQFSPLDNNVILYNHEWPADCGIRRMWIFDGRQHIRIRTEGEGRHRDDWTCHEMWERGTGNLIYHGKYKSGIAYIGRAVFDDPADLTRFTLTEISLPKEYVKYGHFSVSNTNLLVTDGYYQTEGEDPDTSGEWITVLKPNWAAGTIEWFPLCRHGSNWDCQEAHPHPVFNHRADAVYFTSNKEGPRAVYSVSLQGTGL